MGTLYPNTSESGKFCSINDSFNKSGYFPPAFLYSFGNIFTFLSRLKRLTSYGYLHLVVDTSLQNPCSYSRLLITIRDHFRCLLRRRRTRAGSYKYFCFIIFQINIFCGIWIHSLLLFGKLVKLTIFLINVSA